jgi:hypothetical protein
MQTSFQSDSAAIAELFNQFFEGIYTGNTTLLEPVFHEACTLFGDVNGQLAFRTKAGYLEVVKSRKSPQQNSEAFHMKLLSLEIIGLTAVAKLHVPMLGFNYYDLVALTKENGRWSIVCNLYSHVATQ